DLIHLDPKQGSLRCLVPDGELKQRRDSTQAQADGPGQADEGSLGRALFERLRKQLSNAEQGACSW
ncbi:MAG: phosphogluconate dehydratase, partial [Betaproteobacteria bacterium]|nr:phosphogluconate dehydratase [Betaproteobacteria bacterium]